MTKLAHLMKDTKSSAIRNANVSKLIPNNQPYSSFASIDEQGADLETSKKKG